MKDALLDPYKADYTGSTGESLANAVYIRLFTPLGSWWADPSLGSRLHELARNKDVARVRVLARQYSEQALAPLVAQKRAKRVSASAFSPEKDQSGAGRMLLLIEVEDMGGNAHTFRYPVTVS